MKASGLMLVLAVVSIAVLLVRGQSGTVSQVSLAGGSSGRGRVDLTVKLNNGTSLTSPVCEALGAVTATIVCQRLGFVIASQTSTVQTMQLPSGSTTAHFGSFSCPVGSTSYSQCSFQNVSSCSSNKFAALSCTLTPAQAAGIGVAAVLFCLLITCIPLLICCCCCCGLCACISNSTGYKNV